MTEWLIIIYVGVVSTIAIVALIYTAVWAFKSNSLDLILDDDDEAN